MEEILNVNETYLTFRLGKEMFAASIEKAINIIEMVTITEVPRSPEYMMGIVNVRGSVLPVIDTRMKFGMPPSEVSRTSVIVTFNIEIDGDTTYVGALVDEPGSVIELTPDQISDPPNIGAKYKSELVIGTFKDEEDRFVLLIDIDKVFTLDELLEIETNTNTSDNIDN
jgi:purine-binding chemotaxis protein CheW